MPALIREGVRVRWLLTLLLPIVTHAYADDVVVFAAGSLRVPFNELAQVYAQRNSPHVTFVFGASGFLRDRIAGGERADIFASANLEHPQSLVAKGWSNAAIRFARNRTWIRRALTKATASESEA